MTHTWADADDDLGANRPHQKRSSRVRVIPGQTDVGFATGTIHRGLQPPPPVTKVCTDSAGYQRVAHDFDRDGRCYFCDARRD
jgi:hypothetical protein